MGCNIGSALSGRNPALDKLWCPARYC